MSEEKRAQLRELQRGTDPQMLLETIRRCQGQLALLASGKQDAGLRTGATVADLTQESRGKRSRPDPFEPDVELIGGWLETEPLLSSKELMQRLVAHKQERYSDRQMRTLQRRLHGQRLRRIEAEMANNGEPKDGGGGCKDGGIESPGSRSRRCVEAAGPMARSEAGPTQWGRTRHGPLGPDLPPEPTTVPVDQR
ncbi:MAG: hypothetical protein ACK5N0_00775 [Synechococcaceae cyanobacterium]